VITASFEKVAIGSLQLISRPFLSAYGFATAQSGGNVDSMVFHPLRFLVRAFGVVSYGQLKYDGGVEPDVSTCRTTHTWT
jgi:hypothetical protein